MLKDIGRVPTLFRLVLTLLVLAGVSAWVLGSLFWSQRQEQKLVHTAGDYQERLYHIQQATTEAHLWLEERMAGDTTLDPERLIQAPLEQSRRVIVGLQKELFPDAAQRLNLPDDERLQLSDMLSALAGIHRQFRHIARQRLLHKPGEESVIGTALDEQMDAFFFGFLQHLATFKSAWEEDLQTLLHRQHRHHRILIVCNGGLVFIVLLLLGFYQYRYRCGVARIRSMAAFPLANPCPVLRLNAAGEVLDKNPVAARGLIDGAIPPHWQTAIQHCFDEGVDEVVRWEIQGRVYLMQLARVPHEDSCHLYGQDITERIQAERKAQRFVHLVERSSDLIMLVDDRQQVIYLNPALQRIRPLSSAPCLADWLPVVEAGEFIPLWMAHGAQGTSWEGRCHLCDEHGNMLPVSLLWQSLAAEPGDKAYFAVVARQLANPEQEQMRLQHLQHAVLLSELAQRVVHDLNNMLTMVLSQSELLAKNPVVPKHVCQQLSVMVAAEREAAVLSHQLLACTGADIRSGKSIKLAEWIDSMRELLRSFVDPGYRLAIDIDSELPAMMMDVGQLQQVLLALLQNAEQAMQAFGRGEVIIISAAMVRLTEVELARLDLRGSLQPGQLLMLEVEDQGGGVVASIRERICEPFFSTRDGRLGMGLSAVSSIVGNHHGGLGFINHPGQGLQVQLFFPVSEAAPQETQRLMVHTVSLQGKKVLLAEDETAVRETSEMLLCSLGCTVLIACDGQEAWEAYQQYDDIDVVFLDWQMPKMDGRQVLIHIRQRNPDARVVLCSGFGRGVLGLTQESRPDSFLQKPYDRIGLQRALLQAMMKDG